jgi:CBS domain-containing protein
MICPNCKAENIPGAEFCESCGADLHDLAHPSADDDFSYHLMNDRLGEIESNQVPSVTPRDPVAFAIYLMQTEGAECVLVMDGGELVGILTERDILLKAAGEKVDLNAIPVRQTMTPDPVVLRADDTLAVALHKMSVGDFRHIPLVLGDGQMRVVSARDVFRHVSVFISEQPATA